MPYSNLPESLWPKMDRCVEQVMAEGKDQPTAIAICYTSITGAAEKANYGARAGQVIAGNLGRGQGGRFARSGSGGSAQPAQPSMSADMGQQLGLPAGTLDMLAGLRAGKPVTADQAQALVAAGLAKEVEGGIVMTRAARTVLAASRRGDVDAARAAIESAKPKPGKGGGKAPKPKPTAEERAQARAAEQERNFLAVAEAAAGIDDQDLARDFLAFARGGDFSTPANARMLEKTGLVQADAAGVYRLSGQGRSFVNAALRGDTRRARDAMSKLVDRGAAASGERAMDQKSIKDRIWEALVGLFSPEETAGLGASFKVLKQADGTHRWVAISSNSYLDRDGEIISQKALEADVARADGDGDYGPLLWWHEPGLELGRCDFNAMTGRMLVESGTFKDARLGEAFASSQAGLGISIGFRHPRSEPGPDGVFKNIRRFERSPLPLDFASNPYTAFSVKKGHAMDQKKREALTALIGEDAANELIVAAQTKQASNEAAGVRTKETEPASESPAAAPAEPYVADLKAAEFADTVKAAFAEAVAHLLAGLQEQQAAAATKAAGEQAQELTTTKAALAEAEAKVKEYEQLIGDLPRAQQRAYRPIGDEKVEVSEAKAKELAPAADQAPRAWLYNFVAGQPEGAQPN